MFLTLFEPAQQNNALFSGQWNNDSFAELAVVNKVMRYSVANRIVSFRRTK